MNGPKIPDGSTLQTQFDQACKNDPRWKALQPPGMAKGIFLVGAQAAVYLMMYRCPNGPIARDVLLAMEALNEEIGQWLGVNDTKH